MAYEKPKSLNPLVWGGMIVLVLAVVLVGMVVIASSGDDSRPERNRNNEAAAVMPTVYNPPTLTPTVQQIIIVITATPPPATTASILPSPTAVRPTAELVVMATPVLPTIDVAMLPTPAVPAGCPTYIVQAGDTLYSIAVQYGITLEDLLAANGIDLSLGLKIGQELIIPIEGCELLRPTIEPSLSGIEIVRVVNPGSITTEGVEIRNNGGVLDLTGWMLMDEFGNQFVFPSLRLYSKAMITVYSRSGTNTPVALYWGQASAMWSARDSVILIDAAGRVVTVYQLP